MKGLNIRSLVFAIVTACIFLISGHWARAEVCNGDLTKLEACKDFVLIPGPQIDPSVVCCHAIHHADIPCVCENIPKGLEHVISMEKVAYIAKFCNNPLQSGMKCGDYTIPKA